MKSHVLTLKDVIDAQAAGDSARVYVALRTAAGHMKMIADAIVKQFPDRYARQ